MAIKHNQQIQKNHFRKDWQRRVRCHFDQPGAKSRRRRHRVEKASKVAPKPVDKLRPIVRCPGIKYNMRVRAGRGFSFQELKAAKIPRKLASTIGIAVDPRRENTSEESMEANVARLREFYSRLILFPRRNGKTKSGEATMDEMKKAKKDHGTGEKILKKVASSFPIENVRQVKEVELSKVKGEDDAYKKLRLARSEARLVGVRDKRAKAKAEQEAATKK
ncbi:MAG: 60S ribosomal protein L13 [Chrysothrix sp. TS-e1954]|nr:MAG: 60S ribosomal protein L13 [Chrysothrix sp. TS-e1954]